MYYEEEFFLAEDYGRRRRPNRNVELECSCNVLGGTDRNPDCGCGRQDPDRTEKHVYHHIVEDKNSCHDSCNSPVADKGCGKGCACHQLKNMAVSTAVTLYLEGVAAPIAGATFSSFDPRTGCATFNIAGDTLVVDCKKIAALLFV
ncbi:hypothetical protein [Lederbergia galactosidilytica]|uniref:Uncharacterized protein n=1 Tax=Lederbergia galactosidilytica TaxID=217031 RepID=A0A177ZIP7_9BACI|nr:hypothetical protein [Lederbergia galactosidilytica]KRG15232.1 hypothetical protein ACA30_08740 [Virgibacillus soli]OAK67802.1 hypothetical protein ABB05_17230 [Lederbergia galactosidilytica]